MVPGRILLLRLLGPLLIALAAVTGWAHEGAEQHDLAGAGLCLEPASVVVAVMGNEQDQTGTENLIRSRLQRSLEETLQTFQVPFVRRESCSGQADFVQTSFVVERLATEGRWGTYAFWLFVEVGAYERMSAERAQVLQPPHRFALRLAARHAEADQQIPFFVSLPGLSEAMIRDLATAWWEDNPVRPPRDRIGPPLLGGVLAAAGALVVWRLAVRRRAGARPARRRS